jgi:hypothetical protein
MRLNITSLKKRAYIWLGIVTTGSHLISECGERMKATNKYFGRLLVKDNFRMFSYVNEPLITNEFTKVPSAL